MFGTRQFATFMAASAIIRVIVWILLIIGYIIGISRIEKWFDSVAFVSVLSALALLLTDWAQFAASAVGLSVVERAEMQREDIAADIDQLLAMAEREESAVNARAVADRLRSKVR
jgi:hypothetical protein